MHSNVHFILHGAIRMIQARCLSIPLPHSNPDLSTSFPTPPVLLLSNKCTCFDIQYILINICDSEMLMMVHGSFYQEPKIDWFCLCMCECVCERQCYSSRLPTGVCPHLIHTYHIEYVICRPYLFFPVLHTSTSITCVLYVQRLLKILN